MSLQRRKELLSEIEDALRARVITLVTGDRTGLATHIAPDILPLISSLLSKRPDGDRIALFLYTPGGDTIVGWSLVNQLRQYAMELAVVVPFRALSCGTLIALGADELYLGRHGLLSPIDPSVGSPYNPPAPGGAPGALLPVSVEDVAGFLEMAREELGLKDEAGSIQILNILADKVHPLALGAVYRAREQTSSLAKRLLQMHLDDNEIIERIVNRLTQELPTHNYLLGRVEAEEIGIRLSELSETFEDSIWNLYSEYEKWLKLTEPYSAELALGQEQEKTVRYERAALEMLNGQVLEQYKFISDKKLLRVAVNQAGVPLQQIAEQNVYEGWRPVSDEEDANG